MLPVGEFDQLGQLSPPHVRSTIWMRTLLHHFVNRCDTRGRQKLSKLAERIVDIITRIDYGYNETTLSVSVHASALIGSHTPDCRREAPIA